MIWILGLKAQTVQKNALTAITGGLGKFMCSNSFPSFFFSILYILLGKTKQDYFSKRFIYWKEPCLAVEIELKHCWKPVHLFQPMFIKFVHWNAINLGLVTYDDSDGSKSSSESDEDEPERSNKSRNDDDSDNELMVKIEKIKSCSVRFHCNDGSF